MRVSSGSPAGARASSHRQGAVIGIDLGTSSVKVLLVDVSGRVLARIQRSYATHRPDPLAVEQDPGAWWDAVTACLREAVERLPAGGLLGAAVTGQLNGLVLLDDSGQVLRNAIIWLDRRGVEEAQMMDEQFGAELEALTLGRPQAISILTKWVWVSRHEPDIARRARWILAPKDFITYMLTGTVGTDFSDAGAGQLLDIRNRTYLDDVMTGLGLPTRCLPPLRPSHAVAGYVTRQAAQQTGLPEGLPVAAGAGDVPALALGSGVRQSGDACVSLGSAGHIAVYADQAPAALDPGLWLLCHSLPDAYLAHALVMTGGLCLQWFHDTFQCDPSGDPRDVSESYAALLRAAAEVTPGSEDLLFLPFLEGAATPLNEPQFRAVFLGATPRHTRAAFARAVLEGVVFNARDGIDAIKALGVPVKAIRVAGGGTRHRLWVEIIASVLQAPAEVLSDSDLSALGAAVLAGLAAGAWADADEALSRALSVREVVLPNETWIDVYDRTYQRYREACQTLLPFFQKEVRS